MSSNPDPNNNNERDEETPSSDSKAETKSSNSRPDLMEEDEQDKTVSCDSRDAENPSFDDSHKRGKVYFEPDKFEAKLKTGGAIFQPNRDDCLGALEIDTDKEGKSSDNIKAVSCEWTVLRILRTALENLTGSEDFPCFLVYNIQIKCARKETGINRGKKTEKNCEGKVTEEEESEVLEKEKGNPCVIKQDGECEVEENGKDESEGKEIELKTSNQSLTPEEKDVIIFHRRFGVVALEVKATESGSKSSLEKAVRQVYGTRDSLQRDGENSLREDAISMAVALPNMEDKGDFDKKDIKPLYGTKVDTYENWLSKIRQAKSKQDPYVPEGTNGDGNANFKAIVTKYCKTHCYGIAVKECAQGISKWRINEDLKRLKASEANFVHIHGPPGGGKTLSLVYRARYWLRKNCRVAILIEQDYQDILLHHLGKECLNNRLQRERDRLTLCRSSEELLDAAERLTDGEKLRVIIVGAVSDNCRSVLEAMWQEKGVLEAVWAADIVDNSDEWNKNAKLFESFPLPYCLRYSDDVLSTLNAICSSPRHPEIKKIHLILPQTLANKTEVIAHQNHNSESEPYNKCSICYKTLKDIFEYLDLIPNNNSSNEKLEWQDYIILYTGENASETQLITLEGWLNELGVPAEYHAGMSGKKRDAPVLLPYADNDHPRMKEMDPDDSDGLQLSTLTALTSEENVDESPGSEANAWRECVLTGKSKRDRQKNVVHVLDSRDFRGLERPVVILVHIDNRDSDPGQQSDECRKKRCEQHQQWWYDAISCCKGKLIVLVLSPSPATHKLSSHNGQGD